MQKNTIKYKSLRLSLIVLINSILIVFNYGIIKAQADYMGPGVPFSAKCYKELGVNTITINSFLDIPSSGHTGTSLAGNILISSTKVTTPTQLQLALNYNSSILNVQSVKLNKKICPNANNATTSIDNSNGIATISVDQNSCPNLRIDNNPKEIANITFMPVQEGTALIKLQDMSGSPQSFAVISSNTVNIVPKQQEYEVYIAAQETISQQFSNTITPPNTGIIDEYGTIIAIGMLGLGLIMYYFIDTSEPLIKTKFIEYQKNE